MTMLPAREHVPALFAAVLLLGIGAAMPARAGGLEGGLTTTSRNWSGAMVPTMIRPDAATRKAELAQREKDVAAQAAALRARLQRTPDAALLAKIHAKLDEIDANFGWVPELKLVMGRRDLAAARANLSEVDPGLIAGLVRLKEDLARRDIDLIVMPFAESSWVYTHLLVDGADARTEYYPGFTKMLLQLMDHGIEVVDFLDELRRQAGGEVDVHWPNDPHTASLGRKIAAEALARRLQRYDFARKAKERAKAMRYETVAFTGARWGWSTYLLNGGITRDKGNPPAPGAPDIAAIMKARPMKRLAVAWPDGHSGKYAPRGRPDIGRDGMPELVLIGDSQLHSAVHGDGLPEFVWAEVGGVCRWGSKSWSGFSLPNIYLETVPNVPEAQPRVVVAMFLFFHLKPDPDAGMGPRPLPAMKAGAPPAEGLASAPFNARVEILEVSKPRDPRKLVYREALMAAVGRIVDGPMKGRIVGLLHWGMIDSRILKPVPGLTRLVGNQYNMELTPWAVATDREPKLGTYQTFDDTTLASDLEAPRFWVTRGKLDPATMKSR